MQESYLVLGEILRKDIRTKRGVLCPSPDHHKEGTSKDIGLCNLHRIMFCASLSLDEKKHDEHRKLSQNLFNESDLTLWYDLCLFSNVQVLMRREYFVLYPYQIYQQWLVRVPRITLTTLGLCLRCCSLGWREKSLFTGETHILPLSCRQKIQWYQYEISLQGLSASLLENIFDVISIFDRMHVTNNSIVPTINTSK